jgi:hypothetical protein
MWIREGLEQIKANSLHFGVFWKKTDTPIYQIGTSGFHKENLVENYCLKLL